MAEPTKKDADIGVLFGTDPEQGKGQEMTQYYPRWAFEAATPQDREGAVQAHRRGNLQIEWPSDKALRSWAKQHGWPAPWFIFDGGFVKKMLENDENFALALNESGIQVSIPRKQYTVPAELLREFDKLYEQKSKSGRPTGWGPLVAGLRDIRRALEAGVVVEIDGQTFRHFGSFYNWAHGRYHALEDGYDSWIGDDKT